MGKIENSEERQDARVAKMKQMVPLLFLGAPGVLAFI
jgi:hypothetical protein